MAKEIRVIQASNSLVEAIDEGAKIASQIKSLGYKDKQFKDKITDNAIKKMENGELSLRMQGKKSAVLVSVSEKYDIDTENENFETVKNALTKGSLDGVVDKKVIVSVAPDYVDEIKKLVGEVIFNKAFAIETVYKVNSDAYRKYDPNGSKEKQELKKALDDCTSLNTIKRVKYEAIK